MLKVLITLVVLLSPQVAHAYIGPGLGAGAIAAVLGVIGSIFVALFAIIYYPVKRVIKRRQQAKKGAPEQAKAGGGS